MPSVAQEMTAIGPEPTNGAQDMIEFSIPYMVEVSIQGTSDILFHRWNCESVEAKSKASKGSKAKRTDDTESYVWRNDDGLICLPGEYLRQSIINAAKYKQDPRSPRKSAMDLFKAGLIALTPLAPLGTAKWEYEHRCRVTIQRNGITRVRPAFKAGWRAEIELLVNLPEYISPMLLHDTLTSAGKLVGVADFRPTYGRFQVNKFDLVEV